MKIGEKKWYIHTKRADFDAVAKRFSLDPVTARVLRNRGLETDQEIGFFLNGTIDSLYDARLLPDIEKAAAAVADGIREGARFRVVGDYDIDGVCATYILLTALRRIGASVDYRIPDRIADGYGINMRIIDEAAADGIDCIITCDNGISAIEELKAASERGICVIVTDHHNVPADAEGRQLIPEAAAVVDVKRHPLPGCGSYPTENICGAVTAWKLVQLLYENYEISGSEWLEFIEFAAVATVGDLMPLIGENRIIVREGLERMSKEPVNPGLKALIEAVGLGGKSINSYNIGFMLGPCINAAGRLESADTVMGLFLSEDRDESFEIAVHLKELNETRKQLTEEAFVKAADFVEEQLQGDRVLVVYQKELHESLTGILAGRLKERYLRPAIVLTDSGELLKGSGRSVEAYNMFDSLSEVRWLFERFGGHPMAAGMSLKSDRLEELRRELNERCTQSEDELADRLWIDAAMPVSYITFELIRELDALAPFGIGNPQPVFARKGVRVSELKVLGKMRNAVRMKLSEPGGYSVNGIAFGDGDAVAAELEDFGTIDILYYPQINEFKGSKSIQLKLESYRKSLV